MHKLCVTAISWSCTVSTHWTQTLHQHSGCTQIETHSTRVLQQCSTQGPNQLQASRRKQRDQIMAAAHNLCVISQFMKGSIGHVI
uniref:Putative secreted protein n=1 Tax=Ixodes ricinus TaxID=34613 RepID=A0A6B0U7I2_IXORI